MLRLLLAAGCLVLLSACSSSSGSANPTITFVANGNSVAAGPIQYCDVQERNCEADGGASVSLSVPAGRTVQVSVPKEVASTPWQVAARFADAKGTEYASCSRLFAANSASAYTVRAPQAGDHLVLIEVYQSSATLVQEPNGDIDTPIRGTWVLTAGTRGNASKPVLPKPGDNLCNQ
ncbi:MAG TPA: DUF2771 family protein [Pseudonocardiaceae bacterium]|nr:DUF2771 family protein [Pseudonocardiaceae bacterium]